VRSTRALALATRFERIAVVPANHTLAPHNIPAPERTGTQQFTLRSFLQELDGFDLVLIDCPPNLYLCSWNAMVAADFVIVPVPPEDFGTQGLRVVHQAIRNVRQLNPSLRLLGHLVTRSDSRLLVHQAYQAKLRELFGEAVFDVVVPEASAFKVSIASREPVTLHSPRSKAGRIMRQLGEEIQRRIAAALNNREVA
jgi:chromosome partitioning protein